MDRAGSHRPIRVLVAVASPLARMRLRALSEQPGLELAGEAAGCSSAIEMADAICPDVLLIDDAIAQELMTGESAHWLLQGDGSAILWLTGRVARPPGWAGRRPSSVAAIGSSAPALRQAILELMSASLTGERPQQTLRANVSLKDRFALSQQYEAKPALPTAGVAPLEPSIAGRARLQTPVESEMPDPITSARTQQRRTSGPQAHLQELLSGLQGGEPGGRDSVTGLPTAKVLERALRSLVAAGCPSSLHVIRLWSQSTSSTIMSPAAAAAVLRSACAALRANLRQEDMICRLDGATFAVVLPGVVETAGRIPISRLRTALEMVHRSHSTADIQILSALGAGYWVPSLRPAQVLEGAWHAMLAERQSRGSAGEGPTMAISEPKARD